VTAARGAVYFSNHLEKEVTMTDCAFNEGSFHYGSFVTAEAASGATGQKLEINIKKCTLKSCKTTEGSVQ
jgi:hypothetical protein